MGSGTPDRGEGPRGEHGVGPLDPNRIPELFKGAARRYRCLSYLVITPPVWFVIACMPCVFGIEVWRYLGYGFILLAIPYLIFRKADKLTRDPSPFLTAPPIGFTVATNQRWSEGRLYLTERELVFVPGAYRSTGQWDKWEQLVEIPLSEIADVRPIFRGLPYPFGIRVTRHSGDLEYFDVPYHDRWAEAIDKQCAALGAS